jgi:hypothetical protein
MLKAKKRNLLSAQIFSQDGFTIDKLQLKQIEQVDLKNYIAQEPTYLLFTITLLLCYFTK